MKRRNFLQSLGALAFAPISAQANSYGLHTATKPLFEGAFIRLEKPLHTAHDLVKECSTKDSFETADIEADFDTTEEHNFSVEELEEIALLGTEIDDTSLVQTLNS